MRTHVYSPIEYVCYGDGCHLWKYAMNPCQCDVTQTTWTLSEVAVVIDKSIWLVTLIFGAKKNCDPCLLRYLTCPQIKCIPCGSMHCALSHIPHMLVDTEQLFSWLSSLQENNKNKCI